MVRGRGRRAFLKESTMAAAGVAAGGVLRLAEGRPLESQRQAGSTIRVDPKPLFELSPYLYMQFMEPLGVTDGSVEAAWDHLRDDWREDVVEVTRELAPHDDAVGRDLRGFLPLAGRRRAARHASRRCSTSCGAASSRTRSAPAEFVDFCRQVGAEPLICVNFESDGRKQYMNVKDSVRTADAQGSGRMGGVLQRSGQSPSGRRTGMRRRCDVRHWQIGNETSYDKNGFDLETAARKTVEFAKAMRAADPVDSVDRVGRQRLGGAHGGGGRRTCAVPRVSSHVRSRLAASGRCCAASCIGATRTRPGSS